MLRAILITAFSLGILSWALPTVGFSSLVTLIIASIVITILYSLVRPVLKLLFLPINIITLGLFSGFINIFLLWLATYLVPGFHIQEMIVFGTHLSQFWSLVFVSILLGFVHSTISKIL
ncbi:phage holin family protein [Candidatus Woesebacteria bacterium]|nr:phage holin family protein [Candidatus Woesebacteria bacterium]